MSEQIRLDAAIMNIQCKGPALAMTVAEQRAYKLGHRDARHAAAELALATQPQAPQGAVTGWQPIETAPKDWTDIQLWARGVWYPECAWGMQTYPGNSERVILVYQDDYDCNGPVYTKVIDPSHWMPPPSAPGVAQAPDTAPMYKALMESKLALLACNSGASMRALRLIDAVLGAAPKTETPEGDKQ